MYQLRVVINSIESDWNIKDLARDIAQQLRGPSKTSKEIYAYVIKKYYSFNKESKKKLRQQTYDEVKQLFEEKIALKFNM